MTTALSLQPTSSRKLKDFWPVSVIVHGKIRHLQSQGLVERSHGDIKYILVTWLDDNNTHDWVTGIRFVQFQKTTAHHSGIKHSPCSALFGEEVRVGLKVFSATESAQ